MTNLAGSVFGANASSSNASSSGIGGGGGGGGGLSVLLQPGLFKFYGNDASSHKQKATLYNPFDFRIKYKVMSTAPLKYLVAEPKGTIKPKSYVELLIRINKNVSFQDEPQQASSKATRDKLRIMAYRLKDNAATYDDSNDDELLLSDSNNNKDNETLISKRDYLLIYMNRRGDTADELLLNEDDLVNDTLAASSYSSLSYGNNLNAIMNMNRSSMGSVKSRLSPLSSAMKKPTILNSRKMVMPSTMVSDGENVNYLVLLIGLICLGVLFLPLSSTTDSSLPKYLHVTVEIKLFASFVMGMVTMVILKS